MKTSQVAHISIYTQYTITYPNFGESGLSGPPLVDVETTAAIVRVYIYIYLDAVHLEG